MGIYEGAEVVLCNAYVEARLAAYAVELDAISPGLSGRIYPDLAPEGATYPFIVYQVQSPPRDVRGVGATRVMVDTMYLVRAVAQSPSVAPLAGVAKVIDQAMTSAAGQAIDDGLVLTSIRETGFHLVDPDRGTEHRHLGGIYRIQAQG